MTTNSVHQFLSRFGTTLDKIQIISKDGRYYFLNNTQPIDNFHLYAAIKYPYVGDLKIMAYDNIKNLSKIIMASHESHDIYKENDQYFVLIDNNKYYIDGLSVYVKEFGLNSSMDFSVRSRYDKLLFNYRGYTKPTSRGYLLHLRNLPVQLPSFDTNTFTLNRDIFYHDDILKYDMKCSIASDFTFKFTYSQIVCHEIQLAVTKYSNHIKELINSVNDNVSSQKKISLNNYSHEASLLITQESDGKLTTVINSDYRFNIPDTHLIYFLEEIARHKDKFSDPIFESFFKRVQICVSDYIGDSMPIDIQTFEHIDSYIYIIKMMKI